MRQLPASWQETCRSTGHHAATAVLGRRWCVHRVAPTPSARRAACRQHAGCHARTLDGRGVNRFVSGCHLLPAACSCGESCRSGTPAVMTARLLYNKQGPDERSSHLLSARRTTQYDPALARKFCTSVRLVDDAECRDAVRTCLSRGLGKHVLLVLRIIPNRDGRVSSLPRICFPSITGRVAGYTSYGQR